MSPAFAAALALVIPTAASAPSHFREGQWETTIKMEMPGMPMAMPPVTTSRCLTKKDFVPRAQQPNQTCKILKQQVKGNVVEWSVQCKDENGVVMNGTGKITYRPNSFAGDMNMSVTGGPHGDMQMKYAMTGKRLGECQKEPAAPSGD